MFTKSKWKLLLAAVSLVTLNPFSVFADGCGVFQITGGVEGTDWYCNHDELQIKSATPMVITTNGETSTKGIVVKGSQANVTLRDVVVDATGNKTAGFDCGSATVNMTIEGTNSFKAGNAKGTSSDKKVVHAGVEVGDGSEIFISGSGSLSAYGASFNETSIGTNNNYGGAGIGSFGWQGSLTNPKNKEMGKIHILSGTIYAQGGYNAAGIGSGTSCNANTIEIKGGNVTAKAGEDKEIKALISWTKGSPQDIGSGSAGTSDPGAGSFEPTGDAVITATTISDESKKDDWNGIFIDESTNTATVHGDVTLTQDVTLPQGVDLVIPEGSSLEVPDDVTLEVSGNIEGCKHNFVVKEAKYATCTEAGNVAHKHCRICSLNFEADETTTIDDVVIPAKGHTEANFEDVSSTCIVKGHTGGTYCSVCNETLTAWVETELADHKYEDTPSLLPTCTEDGHEKGKKCSVCGDEIAGAVIPAEGHDYQILAAVAATCTSEGKTQGETCSVCGDVKTVQETIAMIDHTVVTDNAVEPTCTEAGKTEGSHCSVCKAILVKQEEIPANGHTVVEDNGHAATCTEDGLTDGSHCSVCEEIIVAQTIIKAAGHTEEAIEDVPATCTKPGHTGGKVCSVCNVVTEEPKVLDVLAHDFTKEINDVPATCTKSGITGGVVCSSCGEKFEPDYDFQIIPALGHDIVEDEAVEATCTTAGKTAGHHCTRCDEETLAQVEIPATGHNEVANEDVEPTCSVDGHTGGTHCSVCNEAIEEWTVVSALGHIEVADEEVAPTCTTVGKTAGSHCDRCKEVLVAQTDIEALGHIEVTDEAVAATCTTEGKTVGTHCVRCKEVLAEQETIEALGHDVVIDPAIPATCSTNGKTEGSHCGRCNHIIEPQEITVTLFHDIVKDEAVAATCTSVGKTEGSHCALCNEVIKEQEEIPMIAHKEAKVEGHAATCSETGLTDGIVCTVCNTVVKNQEVIEKLAHTVVTDEGKAATCTEEGLSEGSHCAVCNETIKKQTVIAKSAHKMEQFATKAATCTEAGHSAHFHCSECDGYYMDRNGKLKVEKSDVEIAKLEHKVVTDKGYAAKCEEDGLTDGSHCSVCNTVLSERTVIPATGHIETKVVGTKASSETVAGYTGDTVCLACNKILGIGEVIHYYVTRPGQKPTCTEDGHTEGEYCTICMEEKKPSEIIPAHGHQLTLINEVEPGEYSCGYSGDLVCSDCGEIVEYGHVLASTSGITETVESSAKVYSYNGHIIVKDAAGKTIQIHSVMGVQLLNEFIDSDIYTVSVRCGVSYIVTVDGKSQVVLVK